MYTEAYMYGNTEYGFNLLAFRDLNDIKKLFEGSGWDVLSKAASTDHSEYHLFSVTMHNKHKESCQYLTVKIYDHETIVECSTKELFDLSEGILDNAE